MLKMHRFLHVLFVLVVGAAAYAVPVAAGESCGCGTASGEAGCHCQGDESSGGAHSGHEAASAASQGHQAEAGMPADHLASPADLEISMRQVEPITVAYVEGTFADDIPSLFGDLMAAAGSQQLFSDNTQVLSVYQGSLETGPTDETPFQAGISVASHTEVSEPLMLQTLAGGQYMVVEHWGAYEQITDTYTRVLSWANENGIEFRESPSFEVYVTDPETAPQEEWLTEIYLPFDHSA
jgi:effector-binding domain-containing protein